MRRLVLFLALALCPSLSAFAAEVPIVLKDEFANDYPPGAADRKERGIAIVAIVDVGGSPKAKLLQTSGYNDLDQSSLALALPYFLSGAMKDTNFIAVRWRLDKDDTAPMTGGNPKD